ncbi:MAG TPA: glycoside hydrolase domain-containing protein [Rhodanobacteraceae bacterium]
MNHVTDRPHAWTWVACTLIGLAGLTATASQATDSTHRTTVPPPTASSPWRLWIPGGRFASSSLLKVPRFPARLVTSNLPPSLHLASVRNAQVSAQLAIIGAQPVYRLHATVSKLTGRGGAMIPASAIQVSYVGYVPVVPKSPKVGGATIAQVAGRDVSQRDGRRVMADPLWPNAPAVVPAHATQPIWFTIHVPATIAPGTYRGHITISSAHVAPRQLALTLNIHAPVLPDPGHGAVRLNVWFNPDAVAVAYGVKPWSPAHWQLLTNYFRFLAKAGQRMILTTIVPQPWRVAWNDWKPQTAVGYDSMVQWSFDGQHWHFDFSRFDHYVRAARAVGLGPGIAAYSLIAFRGPQRLTYTDTRTHTVVNRTLKIASPEWNDAWCTFMHAFTNHLKQHGWLQHTWIGFDERPADILEPAMRLLRRCAPTLAQHTLMAGTSDISAYAQNLSLGWADLKHVSNAWIDARHKAGKLTTFYTWAGTRHPNTLSFSPAVESRMLGWIIAKRHLDGYLHWAFDDWTHDVFKHPAYAFSQGDEYLVYPGKNAPMPSIRWKLLLEGLQDAELVHMARANYSHNPKLKRAIALATRDPDGRSKNISDIIKAHAMVVSLLEHPQAGTEAPSSNKRKASMHSSASTKPSSSSHRISADR